MRRKDTSRLVVLAIHCHPDDIEFSSAGTMFLLRETGCDLHYMTIANGSCGSVEVGPEEIAETREREARSAAALLGAVFHRSLSNDLEVFYTNDLIRRVLAIVREVGPDIMLVPSPEDYTEDHTNSCRIAVTAAFARGVQNFASIPPVPPLQKDVAVYHTMPHGLRDPLRRSITADFYVDITSTIDRKERMLACHESQKSWLERSQGMGSYLAAMREMSTEVGAMSGSFRYAEGWRRRSHLGLSAREIDPLGDVLRDYIRPAEPTRRSRRAESPSA